LGLKPALTKKFATGSSFEMSLGLSAVIFIP